MKFNISLDDLGNIATIVNIPLLILTWFFTREHFAKFWKKWFKWILVIAVFTTTLFLWHKGWLNWLQYRFACPVWALILLSMGGLAIASFIMFLIALLNRTPDHSLYLSDNIFGIEWCWQPQGRTLHEDDLVPYCPTPGCSCRLDPLELSGYQVVDDISLVCDHCGFKKDFDCNWDTLRWKALKEIDRRIRTGEFKERLSKND